MKQHVSCKDQGTTHRKSKIRSATKSIPRTFKTYLPAANIYPCRRLLKRLALASAILAVLTLVLMSLENESYYRNDFELSSSLNRFRILILSLCLLQVGLTYAYYLQKLEEKKAYKEISMKSKIWDDPLCTKMFFLELILGSFCSLPLVSVKFQTYQLSVSQELSLDDIIYMCSFCKLYFVLRLVHELSDSNSEKMRMYCYLQNENPSVLFSFKAFVSSYSMVSIFALTIGLLVILSLEIRVCDRTVNESKVASHWDALWLIGVTQTSVGYGDSVPLTHVGRCISFLSALFGIFMHSYTVVAVNRQLSFSKTEAIFYSQVKFAKAKKQLKKDACVLIQIWWKKRQYKGVRRFQMYSHFLEQIKAFSVEKRKILSFKNRPLKDEIIETSQATSKVVSNYNAFLEKLEHIEKKGKILIRNQFSIHQKVVSFEKFNIDLLGQRLPLPESNLSSARSQNKANVVSRQKRDQAVVSHISKMASKASNASALT